MFYVYSSVEFHNFIATERLANNESSEVVDIILPVTFYFNPSTRRDNVKNFWIYMFRYSLNLAHLTNGVVVSNDKLRDLFGQRPEWKEVISRR